MGINRGLFILVIFFGSSSWMGTNSVWMELPLLTSALPEGWGLPSYLAMVVQIACIGPLIYGVLHKCCCSISSQWLIIVALLFATFCQFGLCFLWDVTYNNFSLSIYLLMFGISLVNATSNVLFMPFMAQFHPSLLNAYFVGMGLSSLVPSFFSLVQGTSNYECVSSNGTSRAVFSPPRFGVSVYFALIGIWTAIATLSFVLLYRKDVESERKRKSEQKSEITPLNEKTTEMSELSPNTEETQTKKESSPLSTHVLLLLLTAIVNAQMNGVIPSIHSYSALPYSQVVYHLGLTISNIISPLSSFIPFFISIRSLPVLSLLTVFSSLTTAFIVYMALQSPVLVFSHWLGGFASITSVSVAAAVHSYLRTVFASLLREHHQSEKWLFWCGVFIQIGSFLGSAVMFPLVNFAGIFHSASLC